MGRPCSIGRDMEVAGTHPFERQPVSQPSGGLLIAAESLGISLTDGQLSQMRELTRLLQEWNTRFNLTSIRDPGEIELKHLADSLAPSAHGWRALAGRPPASLLDVGSGAGFPALPLAILCADMRVTALEKSRKKCEFIAFAAAHLGLDVRVVKGRAETEGQLPVLREKFDLVIARAVAYLPALAEYCLPFARVGGHFIAMKSESLEEEIADGIYAVERLGGLLHEPLPYTLPGVEGTRYLLIAEKVARTPEEYPRPAGVPSKRPIVA